ncbi:AAA family ATPase [Ruegeria sp.]|uniref:AAA family ATPase n=1 Tax=Ruegeria sp. TaxID=1879320 RepID=UPI003B006FEE
MAVYYFNWSIVSRGKAQSPVAAAAYRHGAKMKSDLDGQTYSYLDKTDVVHTELTLPDDPPDWVVEAYGAAALGRVLDGREATEANRREAIAQLSAKLWNDVEQFELASNRRARTARMAGKIIFALPVELDRDAHVGLARAFVQNSLASRGAVVDWVLHEPEVNDEGEANPHIHAMVTLRHCDGEHWGLKNRVWDQGSLMRTLRAEWAREANIALEQAGRPERIDHRKLVNQGIELEATSYDRTLADALEARGEELRRKVTASEALEHNRDYLQSDPEHALVVVSSERTVFTAEDVADVFRRNGFGQDTTDDLTQRAMGSMDLIGVVQETPAGAPLFTTRAQIDVESNVMVEALALAGSEVSIEVTGRLEQGAETTSAQPVDLAASRPEQVTIGSEIAPEQTCEHPLVQTSGPPLEHPSALASDSAAQQAPTPPAAPLTAAPDEATALQAIIRSAGLDEAQQAALEEMVSPRRLALVSGVAGAGKTRVIGAAAQIWKARGFEVLGGAISGKASQSLAQIEGMRVASLAAWEARWARGEQPTHGRFVLFVDEAGMVGTATWDRVQHQVSRMGGVLRPVGDPEQLQPVLDTNVFGRLNDRIGGVVIDTVRRMQDAGDRKATQLFAQGAEGVDAALAYYRDKGAIKDADTVTAAIQALAEAYYPSPSEPELFPPRSIDPIEAGAGPIVLALPEEPAPAADTARPPVAWTGKPRATGPSVAVVREALIERAEDLFHQVFGEPVRVSAREWQARSRPAQVMRMQGPKRGLWHDYSAGEGGDLLDLVACAWCGLGSAKDDFPRVMKDAARYCGITPDQPVDETALRERKRLRQRAAEQAERQEAARRAALVHALEQHAQPVMGTAAGTYLLSRGLGFVPNMSAGWLPPVPGEAVRSPDRGSLVIWARNAKGAITGGQRILVNPDGSRVEAGVRKPSFGSIRGSCARFPAQAGPASMSAAPLEPVPLRGDAEKGEEMAGQAGADGSVPPALQAEPPLVIAEGPESALSIWQATGYETWAVFGASNWQCIDLPKDRPVILAPDRDAPDSPAGQAFRKAVLHHLGRGVTRLRIAVAPEPAGSKADLNDTLQRAGPEAVRKAIEAARPVMVQGEAPSAVPLVQPEPTRVALGYSGRDVDALNAALRARAVETGRVDAEQEIQYGDIVRVDRRGLVPKRYSVPMRFAPGDRVIFTQAHRDLDIPKSSFALIEATRPHEIDLVLDGEAGRRVTIDMSAFDHFDYGYAATSHKLQGVTVDHAYALAHPRMSRPISYVMMSRHRESVEMYVPQSRFRDMRFEDCARRDAYLELGWDGEHRRRRAIAGVAFGDTDSGARADALLPDRALGSEQPISGVGFLRDAHLLAVMRRTAGLLSASWAGGDPEIVEDRRGYAAAPARVIDDLMHHRSTIRAEQVAARLSRIAPHPETFVRLFREAMAHPDLLALGGEDHDPARRAPHRSPRPRVYSTRGQVDLELGALDLGMTLGLAHRDAALGIEERHVTAALARAGWDARGKAQQNTEGRKKDATEADAGFGPAEVVHLAAQARQVQLITGGSGSGKTVALAVLAAAHEAAGLQVHCLGATRGAARVFAETAKGARGGVSRGSTRTVAGFIRALEAGRISLDAQSVIVLDEARMLGAGDTGALLELVQQSGAKLIAAWDPAQVGAVQAGRVFDDLADRLGALRLEGMPRARTQEAREIAQALQDATGPVLAERLVSAGCVRATGPREAAITALVEGYLKDSTPDRVVIVGSQAEALDVNRAIHARLHPDRAPAPEPVQGATQGDVSDNEGPEDLASISAATLAVGDRIRLNSWYAPARLPAGTVGTVVEADEARVRIGLGAAGQADPGKDSCAGTASVGPDQARFVEVRREDAEFRCGFTFAQTVYEAKGQGFDSVHALVHPGMTRVTLGTAMGLHAKTLRLVVPSDQGADVDADPMRGAQEMLSGILSRREQDGTVAGHVLDPMRVEEQVRGDIRALRRHARGAGRPWALPETSPAGPDVSAAELIEDPARILPVMAARDLRFTLGDLRREIAARVRGDNREDGGNVGDVDIDGLVSAAMGSDTVVWLQETAPDGAALFTTRANENAAYLMAHPAHILTLIGAERTMFTLEELRGAFERRLPPGSDIDGAWSAVQDSPALVALEAWGARGHRLFTTKAHISTEQALVTQAGDMAAQRIEWDAMAGTASDAVGSGDLSDRLTGSQRRAGEAMLDGRGLVLVRGVAGAGKTTVLKEVAALWKARGFDVCGGAISGRVTRDLGEGVEDMAVASLAAWEARWAQGWRPSGKGLVFVMDEAGMVGADVWARVQERVARLGGKLIAVGDPAQLQPVSSSSAWMAVESELGSVVIDRARRQISKQERKWTEGFAAGGVEARAALKGYAGAGAVQFTQTAEAGVGQLAEAYYNTGTEEETRLALAYTREDVARLNSAIRAQALDRGVVDAHTVRSYGTVEQVVQGKVMARDLVFGVGDRVLFEEAGSEAGIPRNTTGTVIRTAPGRLALRLDGSDGRGSDGQEVALAGDEIAALDHGYATTLHRSQGVTVDHAFTLAHGGMDRHLIYVAMSRHVHSTQVFVPRARVKDIETLSVMAQRSSEQTLARYADRDTVQDAEQAGPKTGFGPGLDALKTENVPPRAGGPRHWAESGGQAEAGAGTGFEEDAHLAAVLGRITGLLASAYRPEDPPVGEDPNGYVETPQRVIDTLTQRRATFGAEDIAREVTHVARCPDTFARMFREAMAHPDLIRLTEDSPSGRLYTTRAHLDLERRVMDRAMRLAYSGHAGAVKLSKRHVNATIRARGLTERQGEILRLAGSDQRLMILRGDPGAGKTFMAAAVADLHSRQGLDVIAVSPTGRGVDHLRRAGASRPMTLAGLERLVAQEKITLSARSVIVLDNAGQVGAEGAERLLRLLEDRGAKLIALQDSDPHAPFEAMPVFRTLEARIGSADLGETRRQGDPRMRAALALLSERDNVDRAVAQLDGLGVFAAGQSRGRAIEKLARAYVRDQMEDKIVLAHSRRDVGALNTAIRAQLDLFYPERMAPVAARALPGSVGDLRVGDRIRLTQAYRPAGLRVGTEARVDRRSRRHVVLRVGSDEEARHLRLRIDDPEFRYSFAFADTIHGARGRGTASVHMLASPGMTRRLLHTGAALSGARLNIVVPVAKPRMLSAIAAITRKDDSVEAALDYGVDATEQARAALRAGGRDGDQGADRPAPGALMDGLDRALAWVADSLDGGVQGVREPAPATRRLESLRGAVMNELAGAHREHTGKPLTLEAQQAMAARIERLVLGRNWRRFVGQGWAVRAFEAESERGHIPGVARRDQRVDRVLRRGIAVARDAGEGDIERWFAAAQASVKQVIEKQKAEYATRKAASGLASENASSAKPDAPVPPAPTGAVPSLAPIAAGNEQRDYRGMALQLAQAISARVPRGDPVHGMDHVPVLEEMLRGVDQDVSRPIGEAELFRLVPYVSHSRADEHRLRDVVKFVMKRGPLMEREVLLKQRDSVLQHLENRGEGTIPAPAFIPRLKVFTHNEVFALHEPDAPWPDSLPARRAMEREVISARLRTYREEFVAKGKEMEKSDIVKDMVMGDITPETLAAFKAAFSLDEIGALMNPEAEMPESLPALDPKMREMIASNLNKAIESPPVHRGSSDAAAPPEGPMIEATPEPEMTPEGKQAFDLALSLASSVSEHITRFSAAHQGDLKTRIADLIKAPPGAPLGGETAEAFAQDLARKRLETEVRREVLKADFPRFVEKAMYQETSKAFVAVPKAARRYEAAARIAIEERIAREGIKANAYERAIAEIATRENSDPELVDTLTEALAYGEPMDAEAMKAQRNTLLNAMIARRVPGNLSGGKEYARAVFAAFTHKEVDALMSEGALPSSLPDLEPGQRQNARATLVAQFSKLEGGSPVPSHNKAARAARVLAQETGVYPRRSGPSSGPSM